MAKTDEIRALKEAEERQLKYDALKLQKESNRLRDKSICRQQNKAMIDQKHSRSLSKQMK